MSQIVALEVGLKILVVVKSTKGATTDEINQLAMPNKTKRSTQRYLKTLCDSGFLYSVGENSNGLRFYLTDTTKKFLEVQDGI